MRPEDLTTALAGHAFEHLFVEGLGCDHFSTQTTVSYGENEFVLLGVAQM